MCRHDMRQCKRSGAPRATACTAVLLTLFTPSQSFSRPCRPLPGAGGNGLALARPRAATAMSGGPPKIDTRTGLPEGYEPPKLNKAQEAMIKRVLEQSKNSNKMKRVEFKSSATAAAKVNDTGVGDNATLDTYFNLPAEKWVTLDDRCAHVPPAPRVLAWECRAKSVRDARCPNAACPRLRALAASQFHMLSRGSLVGYGLLVSGLVFSYDCGRPCASRLPRLPRTRCSLALSLSLSRAQIHFAAGRTR